MEEYEGAVGEAVVRHLIAHLPNLDKEVPKVYCIVKGPQLSNTRMDFAERMKDLNLNFVSSLVLKVRESDRNVYEPQSQLSPVMLQVARIIRAGADGFDVSAGWAYMKTWERRQYKVRAVSGGSYEIVKDERSEGNYSPQ